MYGNIKRIDMKEITKEIKEYLLSVGYPDKEKIFYLDVWLWLWREKKIHIENDDNQYKIYDATEWEDSFGYHLIELSDNLFKDTEEAIISAIEYLVENDLIK